jgi:hypothetical protein
MHGAALFCIRPSSLPRVDVVLIEQTNHKLNLMLAWMANHAALLTDTCMQHNDANLFSMG